MATLKTNYIDDMFSGDRKYREIRNSDGTVSFEDVTEYSQEGDVFASADINATNTEVNGINTSLIQMNSDILWYGTCTTAAATQAKVATTTDGKLGNLTAGQKVAIKMTNNNTHATPTLNVDGKGAKSIKAFGTTAPTVWWKAGDVVTFVYDGTNWIMGVSAGEIEQINASLTGKVSGFSDTTYSAVTGLAYDATSKKLGLKVGADTVIPFSGGFVKSILKAYMPTSGTGYIEYIGSGGARYSATGNQSTLMTYINTNIPEFTNVQWVYQQGVRFEVAIAGYYSQSKDTAPTYYNVGDTFQETYASYNDIIYYGETNPFE